MIEIKQIFRKEEYMSLLLEADPDEKMIRAYLKDSDMYGIFDNNKIICEIVITKVNDDICELKNVATTKEYQGKGYAKKLIQTVVKLYKNKYKKMIVGTTENNIPFYVKVRI